jgi:hypothetical protein
VCLPATQTEFDATALGRIFSAITDWWFARSK